MSDFQLLQDRNKSLPYLSQWSKKEVAHPSRKFGNTDHWTKMKHKSLEFEVHGNDGNAHRFSGDTLPYEKRNKNFILPNRHEMNGSMQNIGVKSFSDWIIQELNGNVPGDYYKTKEPDPKVIRTAANDRAKDDFRYWFIEKKPSTYSKWTGVKGNTLGLAG